MGVSTSIKIGLYNKEKEFIKKIDLDSRADEFIYKIVNDGGATFEPEKLGDFDEDEKEVLKVYFDKDSVSVAEGYAKVTENIQSPKDLKKIWTKIRTTIIRGYKNKMVDYHKCLSNDINSIQEIIKDYNGKVDKQGLFSKSKKIESPSFTALMTEYNFDRLLFDSIWSLDCISQVLLILDLAIKEDNLVEITAADY